MNMSHGRVLQRHTYLLSYTQRILVRLYLLRWIFIFLALILATIVFFLLSDVGSLDRGKKNISGRVSFLYRARLMHYTILMRATHEACGGKSSSSSLSLSLGVMNDAVSERKRKCKKRTRLTDVSAINFRAKVCIDAFSTFNPFVEYKKKCIYAWIIYSINPAPERYTQLIVHAKVQTEDSRIFLRRSTILNMSAISAIVFLQKSSTESAQSIKFVCSANKRFNESGNQNLERRK